ncbi:MAG: DNA-formamidopyrimidine glycosylase family protein [Arcanobacterium sp.]|nr:DNA-formamidopyrimidine glycosylase family protein [Arcanobacterium sp.]
MPELPEVESIRAGVAAELVGARITEVTVLHERVVRKIPGGAAALAQAIVGHRVCGVERRGKFMWLEIEPAGIDRAGAGKAETSYAEVSDEGRAKDESRAAVSIADGEAGGSVSSGELRNGSLQYEDSSHGSSQNSAPWPEILPYENLQRGALPHEDSSHEALYNHELWEQVSTRKHGKRATRGLVIHLGMSGQLLIDDASFDAATRHYPAGKNHERVRFEFVRGDCASRSSRGSRGKTAALKDTAIPGGASSAGDPLLGSSLLREPFESDSVLHNERSGSSLLKEPLLSATGTTCREEESASERGTLRFVDQRTFGFLDYAELVPAPDGRIVPASVAHIAPDALELAAADLAVRLAGARREIKRILLDQTVVSGIGNIYADESLFAARINPRAKHLSLARATRLAAAVREILLRALAAGGTSFDQLYRNANGEAGYFERELAVYGRTGELCRNCGEPLRAVKFAGRHTHYCASCQRR